MISSLKRAREKLPKVPARMGALYEDVEKFFGDIFARYGLFLAKYPIVFVIVALLASLLLGTGYVSVQYVQDVEQLYTPLGSPAHKDRDALGLLFPDHTRDAFYPYQLLHLGTFGEVFVQTSGDPGDSVLQEHVILEIRDLYRELLEVTLDPDDRGMKYSDLCAERHDKCVVDGLFVIDEFLKTNCLNSSRDRPFHYKDTTGHVTDIREVLAEISMENHCIQANVLRLRFNLKHDSTQHRMLSMRWERKFLSWLENYAPQYINITYAASESLDMELADHLGGDAKYFSMTIVIMVLYATFVSSGGNWVSTRMLLAHAGIISALLAILASFGLLSMCGLQFVDISGVMPFLLLGIGLDDMFIIMAGWRQTDIRFSIEDRTSQTFRTSAISVTITSLTNILAFCIGATSPFLTVRNFCISAGIAVFFCYINQLMFFGGCLVLHARRVESSRHCVTCRKTSARSALTEARRDRLEVICCSGQPPKVKGEDDSLCEKIPQTFLPRFLLQPAMKTLIFVLFVIYLAFSIWGASQLKIGVKLESVVPKTSYLSDYMEWKAKYFSKRGPYVMFVVMDTVDYSDDKTQKILDELLLEAKDSGYIHKEFNVSWLAEYLKYRKNISPDQFVTYLRTNFLPHHSQFENDILFSDDGESIVASRFYCESTILNDSTQETNMMTKMRAIANSSEHIHMIAYSPEFIYYEHYVSILKNTLLAVGVAIIGMLFIALMFIPHPISITCATLSMITIVIGMFGFMHFWGLELSAITNVQIILSVGFSVDFTIHISHAFMAATGKNRNERVVAALQKVGIPILNAALTSILGILMLAFSSSYAFRSFFKTMLLVILLGLFHSLMVLPVLLSFIGPRRTSRPRVFIPISPNAKMPTDTAGPFTGPPRPRSEGEKSNFEHGKAKTGSMELLQIEDGYDKPNGEQKGLLSIREEPSSSSEMFSGIHDHYGAFSPRAPSEERMAQDVEVEVRLEASSSTDTITEYHETSTEPPTPIPMRRSLRDSRV